MTEERMNTQYLWNDADRRKARHLKKPVPVPLYAPHLIWTDHESNLALGVER